MKLVLTRDIPGDFTEKLSQYYDPVTVAQKQRPLEENELREAIAGAEVVICQLTDRIDEGTLSPATRCVITYSVGLNHLDVDWLHSQNVRVSHTPVVLTDATADLTWALILSCARWVAPATRYVRERLFRGFNPTLFLGMNLRGATLGILGMGRIGQAVSERAGPFGMNVIYHTPNPDKVEGESFRAVSLEELFQLSDVLSVHCPLTSKTHHLISQAELTKMKKNAVLVNTARGPVINEVALEVHLRENPQFRVGLDVYEREPEISPGLLSMDNALCLPHMGSANENSRLEMARVCVEEAIRFAKGEPLRYEVSES